MSRYFELKDKRSQFLEITGVPVEEFELYLPQFVATYHEVYPPEKTSLGKPHRQQNRYGRSGVMTHMEDKLLLIWMVHKAQVPSSVLGPQFGLSRSQTDYWIDRLSPVLELTFSKLTMLQLPPNCVKLLQALNTHLVEYLVIGGYAVAFHGYRRPILDLDIFIATDLLNAQKLVRVLQAVGHAVAPQALEIFQLAERVIRIGQPPFTLERFALNDRFIQLGASPKQFEIMTSISAVTFEECYPERVSGVIAGTPVQVIGLAHLKRNKQASIRQKDADDFAHL